ncbi:hypothetical protein [Erythrobacter ani]|uniref:Uncharacterized protein n=1 Tax=Erythrobacter ani TaxID=2827235 RepID=A0ABS6SLI8_9SPHN|nr:hypothetical protein [Erythrobacter ani]MBV7265372.1 hypothetical protein [Erythrobacter ani]
MGSIKDRFADHVGSIAGHRAFAPLLAVWGALLFGLSVLVIPHSLVSKFLAGAGLGIAASIPQIVMTALAACVGCLLAWGSAVAVQKRTAWPNRAGMAFGTDRQIEPFDLATDLGSETLGEPLVDDLLYLDVELEEDISAASIDVAGELRDGANGAEQFDGQECDDAPEQLAEPTSGLHVADDSVAAGDCAPSIQSNHDAPRDMSLADFADLPGRNAVWVQEPAEAAPTAAQPIATAVSPETESAEITAEAPSRPGPQAAISKLRGIPPGDLSLIQMVERFAAALHERQQKLPGRRDQIAGKHCDTTLAEALKSLTMFTGQKFASGNAQAHRSDAIPVAMGDLQDTTRELRAALAKLQRIRGAA